MSGCFPSDEAKIVPTQFQDPLKRIIDEINERLNKLELDHLDKLNSYAFISLKKRCDDLEELIYEVKAKQRECDRKPHKCPVCEGSRAYQYHHCKSCEGKGVIWG